MKLTRIIIPLAGVAIGVIIAGPLWYRVFQGDADRLYAKLPSDNVVKRALIFDANPRVQRIVFICVPIAAAIWRPTGSVHSAPVSLACRANS